MIIRDYGVEHAYESFYQEAFATSQKFLGSDPESQLQFMEAVDEYKDILHTSGLLTHENEEVNEEAIRILQDGKEQMHHSGQSFWEAVWDRSLDIGKGILTTFGGVAQIAGGIELTGATGGFATAMGAAMITHGANNFYEGIAGIYIAASGRHDKATGKVKMVYEKAFTLVGMPPEYGDITYNAADIALSGYGIAAKVHRKPGSIVIFRVMESDLERGYKAMSKYALALEGANDFITGKTIYKKIKKYSYE